MNAQLRNWGMVIVFPLLLLLAMLQYFMADAKLALYLAITVFVILVWALEVLPSVLAAILLPLAYIVLDIAPASKVFAPWFTFLPWVGIAGLVFGDILGRTGLARRIALWCVKSMGGTYTSIAIGFMLAGLILVFLVPSIMARVVIFYAVACGFADALDVQKGTRMSSALLMSSFFGATTPAVLLMTGAEQNLLGISFINQTQEIITWNAYLIHNLPVAVIYCLVTVWLVHLIKGKETLPAKDIVRSMVEEKLAEMGPVKASEIKILVLLVAGVSMFVVLGTNLGPWMFTLVACLAFFPGFSLINEQQLKNLNFGFIFFVSGCMAIGFAATHLGIPAMIASALAPILQGQSGLMGVLASYFAGLGLNFLLTPLAATSSMSGPLVELAAQLGMNPAPFIYAFIYGLDQYIFPYEYALLLYFFMDGRIILGHIIPPLALRMALAAILLAAVAYPYWSFLGIIYIN